MAALILCPIAVAVLLTFGQPASATFPNFFIGIRIRNPEILKQIENAQKSFVELINDESSTIKPVAPVTAHVTLLTGYTDRLTKTAKDKRGTLTEDAETTARKKLSDIMVGINKLKERKQSKKLLLNFKGIGDFSDSSRNPHYYCAPTIFYAKPGPASEKVIRKIAALVRNQFSSATDGFESLGHATCDDDYVPHLTIMTCGNFRAPATKPELPTEMAVKEFGLEEMWGIELCYMGNGKWTTDGYYDCPIQLALNDKSLQNIDVS